jgi:7,8-dihydropterin-6-yl-methyl-4-(beta-D-ribofuranosyl)aminobenzene 5'-phosphate synthase
MIFKILFDNYNYDKNLTSLWGFSCLIELKDETILFDTGSNGRILLKNAKKMGIKFKDIDTLFISHSHWDHIGGLDTVIEENPNIRLIVPNTLSLHLIDDLKTLVKEVIVLDNNFTQIDEKLYSTGVFGNNMKEQSLVINQDNHLYIISGCSHPGIDKIEKRVIQNLKRDIKYIIGGFHLKDKTAQEIQKVIDNLSTKYVTATHCTGNLGIKMIKEAYQTRFIDGGVGAIIEI